MPKGFPVRCSQESLLYFDKVVENSEEFSLDGLA